VVLSPSAQLSRGDLIGFGILVLSALVYSGAYFSLGVMVSSLTSRAFTSITALISIWVLMTVGLPNVSPYIAQHLIPAPAIQEVEREKWAIGQEEDENRGVREREYRNTTTDPPKVRGVVLSELWRDSFTNIARRQEEV